MKKYFIFTACIVLLGTGSCKRDSSFLDVPPTSVITTELAFSDPALVLSILGDLYNRQVDFSNFDNGWASFADFSEAFPSDHGAYGIIQNTSWDYGSWGIWDYGYIRDLNLFIQRATASTKLQAIDKSRFLAEARFLRANYYFELVKRMGGVPLVTTPLTYDYSGNVTSLQVPRSKESAIYDFVISEAEAIKTMLPVDATEKSRATAGAALAMESRAALYAASIAKYGAGTPQVSTPGGEVGINATLAPGYYAKSLAASQAIITGTSGAYQLYKVLPDLSDNFAAIFLDKSSVNQESIFIEDYKVNSGKVHPFTTNDQPFSISDEGLDAGRLDPSLNLVEAFEKLDNTYVPMQTTDGLGHPVYYTSQLDIFANRDARLAGTVLLPDGLFKGKRTDVWAGYILADGSVFTSSDATQLKALPGTTNAIQVVGRDGPDGQDLRTQTGFYIRKYLDPTVGSGRRGRGSDVAFIRYRYAEVLLNAAEAAFALGDNATAAGYMNQVRARAGLVIPLAPADITFDRIVHERRVELAFEGHTLFDMKRWRIAHIVWDGNKTSATDLVSNIGVATHRSTQPWGLWPYKYYNTADAANNGKWIFKAVLPPAVTGFDRFQFGNYYSNINNSILTANPKLVKQPNQ